MKKRYEAPVVEIVEVGVVCLLTLSYNENDDYDEML